MAKEEISYRLVVKAKKRHYNCFNGNENVSVELKQSFTMIQQNHSSQGIALIKV